MDSDIGQASIIGYGRYTKTCIGTVQVNQCIKHAEKPVLKGTTFFIIYFYFHVIKNCWSCLDVNMDIDTDIDRDRHPEMRMGMNLTPWLSSTHE